MARVSWPSLASLKPQAMPQHVGMHKEREFRRHARPGNHAHDPPRCTRPTEISIWVRATTVPVFDLIEQPMNRCAEQSFSAAAIAMLPYLLLAVR
jgi:hypothetical protein